MKTEFVDVKMQTKQCTKCGWIKPLYEFYGPGYPTKDKHNGYCIDCCKDKSKKAAVYSKSDVAIECRKEVISALRKDHIFATTGKASQWKQIDVVAWGCVKIRVAQSNPHNNGKFMWGLRRGGSFWDIVDLVILICNWGDRKTYHVFSKDDPVFFTERGRKTGITFNPSSAWQISTVQHGPNLTSQMMKEHENKWSLIEKIRLLNAG